MRSTEVGVGVVAQKLLPPTEVTLNAAADTYIAQSTATLNFGTDTSIDITGVALSGWEAGLVRFDAAAIQSAVGANTLQTARLQLTMNGASLGAGNSQVAIHRMTMPWVEQRATWLCANDTDHSLLGRFVNNCTTANRWGIEWWSFLPRPFVEQPTATVTLGFGQTGVVTADVAAMPVAPRIRGATRVARSAIATIGSFPALIPSRAPSPATPRWRTWWRESELTTLMTPAVACGQCAMRVART